MEAGMDHYLSKPISFATLTATLRDYRPRADWRGAAARK
jgi:DNA-binding response OmpR family regulator